ncbi:MULTISPECIES: hypothetical protein [Prochlorococcus]|uniref:hypothetical protein n=1 Tax=Prochlorococcus TaxID=1218 RepID=UPI0005338FED|nr:MULTISPECIES: hypothetical protein [Prochlorococcus]KGG12516.1 hypothetical protein EV05_1728 [Prochlorococcus sp. MIT 0601]
MRTLQLKTMVKFLLLFISPVLLISCVKNNTDNTLDNTKSLESLIAANKKTIQTINDTKPSREIDTSFIPLKSAKKLKSDTNFGKTDPFSAYSDSSSNILSNSLKLKGIIYTDKVKYALIKYKTMSGQIKQGEIGGQTTKLLPMGVKVKEIDVKNQVVVLTLKGKNYQLSY